MDQSIFRLYDIRGKYPKELDEKSVFFIALNSKKFFPKRGKIIVGHDARLSSPKLYSVLVSGLEKSGFEPIKIGFSTSPMMAFFIRELKAKGAVMITASHNPKEYNGLGIYNEKGKAISGRRIYEKIKEASATKYEIVRIYENKKNDFKATNFHKQYANFLKNFINAKKQLKVIVDCSNGSAGPVWKILKEYYQKLGIKIVLKNNKPNGNFPAHGPNPLAKKAINNVKKEVLKQKADAGVIFDGDGDRAVFLDENGNEISSYYAWRLLALSQRIKKTIASVTEEFEIKIMSETLSYKPNILISPVGHLFLINKMIETKSDLGVESSGHYYFKDFFHSDSGILAAIKFINSLSALPYQLSSYISMLPKIFYIPEIVVKTKKGDENRIIEKFEKIFSKLSLSSNKIDGASFFFKNSFVNIRPSNTEDIVRINIVGTDKKEIERLRNLMK
ncbi:MAG: hypothetical protein WCW90_02240 [Candidatus Paceibacterota bacterium]